MKVLLVEPARHIIYRERYAADGAREWKRAYRRLARDQRAELLGILQGLNAAPRERPERITQLQRPFRGILEHYYPGGQTPPKAPPEATLVQQGVSVGYDSGPG